jgi:hypothetical protein
MRTLALFLLSQSILLPLIIGLIRLRRIRDEGYQPFFILLAVGFLTELISFILIKGFHHSNIIPLNIYSLVEWTLIAWQFHVWHTLRQRKVLFYCLLIFTMLAWVTENLIFWKIVEIVPYFRLLYSFEIVLLSVNLINFMITHDNRSLLRNPKFLICIGFIIYFFFMILYFWALQVSRVGKTGITSSIIFVIAYVNVLTNSIFAVALLLVPAKAKFTLK